MQSPPPFHGYEGQPQPQKPKTNGLVILFAVLGVLLVCCGLPVGVIGFYGFKGFKGAMEMTGCFVNVESMKTALHEYVRTHDGKLPDAKTWQTDISKYFTNDKDMEGAPMKIWKAGGEWSCEEGNMRTGFSFNEELSGKLVTDVVKKDPNAIAIFETKTVAFNQSGKFEPLPKSESPKMIGGMMDEHRGWMLVNAEATHVYTRDADGKLSEFDFGSTKRSRRGGLNVTIDTNSDSGKGTKESSNDSSEDKSN